MPSRELAKRCLLALVGVLIGLVMVEVLTRCLGLFVPPMLLAIDDTQQTEIPYSRPHQVFFAEENRVWARRGLPLQELGYHTPHSVLDGANGVIVLGDSFTAAPDVRAGEGFVELLQEAQDPLPVVNLGVGGAGLENMNYQLRSLIDLLRPKLVVCAIYADDLRRHRPDWLLIRNRPVARLDEGQITYVQAFDALRGSLLYYHSRVYQIDNYLFRKRREQFVSNALTFGYLYRLNEALLRDMKSTCERNNSRLMVMFIPSRKSVEARDFFLNWTRPRSLSQICSLHRIPLLDLTPYLRTNPSTYYKTGDVHFNAQGHRLAFARLHQFIGDEGLLGGASTP